jgi:hypothetical protein
VDAALSEAREGGELLVARQPQLELRGAQPKAEERREVYRYCRTLT